MSRRRQAIKKRSPNTLLEAKVKQANLMLRNLKKGGIKEGTWASRKLYDRLSGGKINVINKKKGQIVIKGGLNKTQKKIISKAITNFMMSDTATIKGIEDVRTRTIKQLRATLSDVDRQLTYDEAEAYYRMFENKDFTYFSDKFGASDMWALIDDAIEQNDDETTFLIRMGTIIDDVNDDDVKDRLLSIYEKYVS